MNTRMRNRQHKCEGWTPSQGLIEDCGRYRDQSMRNRKKREKQQVALMLLEREADTSEECQSP